jgi:hypothetical protein
MSQLSETELRDAIIATRKDAKLIAAAKNDRTNSPASLYNEFSKLPVERRREIIVSVCNEYFVAAQWKIAFPLNNFPAAVLPDAVLAAGKALFLARNERAVREVVRAIRIFQQTPFLKQVAVLLGEAAEMEGERLGEVAEIITSPEVYGLLRELDSASPGSEKILMTVVRVANYTHDLEATFAVAGFLYARRQSAIVTDLCSIVENSIFLARDPRSVRQILTGFNAGGIDAILLNANGNKALEGSISDFAWKTRDWKAIRSYLQSVQR